MFLLPALGASIADTLVIYLHASYVEILKVQDVLSIENTAYLVPLSIIRLILLLPLNIHTYTGTRLKFPLLYTIFHATSASVILFHFFAFARDKNVSWLSPDSIGEGHGHPLGSSSSSSNDEIEESDQDDGLSPLSRLLSTTYSTTNILQERAESINNDVHYSTTTNNNNNNNNNENDELSQLQILHYNLIWILLTLSLTSIALHVVILLHVKSSAPSVGVIERKKGAVPSTQHVKSKSKRKVLAYWIYDRYHRSSTSATGAATGISTGAVTGTSTGTSTGAVTGSGTIRNNDKATISRQDLENRSHVLSQSTSSLISNDESINYADSDDGNNNSDHVRSDIYYGDYDPLLPPTPLHIGSTGTCITDSGTGNNNTKSASPSNVMDRDEIQQQQSDNVFIQHIQSSLTHPDQVSSGGVVADEEGQPRRRNMGLNHDNNNNGDKNSSSRRNFNIWGDRRRVDLSGIQACFTDGYDEFLTEIRSRFEEAKSEWKERLEEVTNRIHQHGNPTTGPFFLLPIHQYLAPFRSLLHLYAHEDVFSNHALDRAFSTTTTTATSPTNNGSSTTAANSNNQALTFYAPQLLCFLLHNSYLNTAQLEAWVLDKCRHNVQFAHRCFWFLRAWYLQGCQQPGMSTNNSVTALDQYNPEGKSSHGSLMSIGGASSGSGGVLVGKKSRSRSNSNGSLGSMIMKKQSTNNNRRITVGEDEIENGTNHILRIPSEPQMLMINGTEEHYKYSGEERQSLENLLSKVIESGEFAARQLEFGNVPSTNCGNSNNGGGSGTTREEEDKVTLNPLSYGSDENALYSIGKNSVFPSMKHLNAATAEHVHGFLPKKTAEKKAMEDATTSDTSYFFRTPDFLDSLVDIADELLHQPLSKRTTELRRLLEELEVNMLPSNSIYIPIQNNMHRVWRIVASDSIALSTKERVPCIVYLEVIACESEQKKESSSRNYSFKPHTAASGIGGGGGTSEQVLERWFKSPRPPQRLNSILSKVSNYTQKGLRKLRDDFEISTQQHHHYTKVANSDERMMSTVDASNSHSFSFSNVSGGVEDSMEMGTLRQSSSGTTSKIARKINRKDSNDEMQMAYPTSSQIKPPLPPHTGNTKQEGKSTLYADEMIHPSHSLPSSRASSRPPSPSGMLGQWLNASQSEESNDFGTAGESNRDGLKRVSSPINDKLMSLNFIDSDIPIDDDNMSCSTNESGMKRRIKLKSSTSSSSSPERQQEQNSTRNNKDKISKSQDNTPTASTTSISTNAKPPPVVFKEDMKAKEARIRSKSAFGAHPNWRLLPILIKSNDDLRQEQLASQLIHCMATILSRGKIPVWLYPYQIIATTFRGGIIEAIPDTISFDSLRKNHPNFTDIKTFFVEHFGKVGSDEFENARANFVESLAAYSIVCFLLQIKDRHNGNILLDNMGHIIHIDFGFFFLSSPGKNSGFESAPFKLTRDFVDLMDGSNSHTFIKFRELCYRTFLELRKNCFQITLLIQMIMEGNSDLNCFRGRPQDAVNGLQERFRLDLNDRACLEYVNSLINESLENWTTTWYDRYQRCCVGVM